MIWLRRPAPVMTLGGLCRFEIAARMNAPALLDRVLRLSAERPDAPIPGADIRALAQLIASCLGGRRRDHRRAWWVLIRRRAAVSEMLRAFLEDPLPARAQDKTGAAPMEPPAPAIAMRAAWIARGADPAVFDGLTLWEHGRVMRDLDQRQRRAMADAAVAARMAEAKPQQFKRFIGEMSADPADRRPHAWVRGLFAATAHLPTMTQQELEQMKGRA